MQPKTKDKKLWHFTFHELKSENYKKIKKIMCQNMHTQKFG